MSSSVVCARARCASSFDGRRAERRATAIGRRHRRHHVSRRALRTNETKDAQKSTEELERFEEITSKASDGRASGEREEMRTFAAAVVARAGAASVVAFGNESKAEDLLGIDWGEMMKTPERSSVVEASASKGGESAIGESFAKIEMPKIDMPELKLPAFKAPTMDRFKMPEMPEMKMPEMPEMKMPEMPEMPAVTAPVARAPAPAAPELKTPVMPELKVPDVPKFETPEMPELKMPDVPKFEMPEMPEMKMPDVPKFDMPEIPEMKMPDVPKFDMPEIPEMKMPDVPKFDMPNVVVPKFDMPNVTVPKFDLPKVDAPEFDFSGATNALSSATSALSGAKSGATGAFNDATGAFDESLKGANDALSAFESGVLSGVSSSVVAGLDAVQGFLPSEFAGLIEMAKNDQDVALAIAALLILSPTLLSAFFDSLRGYNGSKRPFFVNEQLEKNSRAFLIDTRNEEDRKENGVPDLRKSARARGAAVEVPRLEERTRRLTENPRAVELRIAGERVQKLTKRGAQVYFLGPEAAALAKQVQSMGGGRKCYTVAGDFNAWRSEGLKLRRKGSYDKNVLDVVGEETSDLAKAGSTFVQTRVGTARTSIKSTVDSTGPAAKAAILVGFVALAYAVSEYEKTLAFIGFLGLQWSLYNKVTSYESPAALFEDLSQTLSPVASIAGDLASTAGASALSAGSAAMEKAQKSSTEMKIPSLADMSVPAKQETQEEE